MSLWVISIIAVGYLSLLFCIAYFAEKKERLGKSIVNNPYVYSLSLAIYCTAWTFYGSVGRVTTSGIEFLAIYLGPTITAPLWLLVLKKIIKICRSQRITSIADFISARYGKGSFLGGLVTIICIIGIVPYISLQLKAIYNSFFVLTGNFTVPEASSFFTDSAFYLAIILAIFAILFGTRNLEANEKHVGLVAVVAFESLVKLIAIFAVGLFVVYGIYEGPGDLFEQVNQSPELVRLMSVEGTLNPWAWTGMIILSMLAMITLPRQFHMSVVENNQPRHVDKAIWLFPLYLFLINLFVIPIAFAGMLKLNGLGIDADVFVLGLPIVFGSKWQAILVFCGGLSAATSMVIIATISLSIMASNNLVMPIILKLSDLKGSYNKQDLPVRIIHIRRIIIISILIMAYGYFSLIGRRLPLVDTGLISFAAVAQFAPAMLLGIFWKDTTRQGATAGLIIGFLVWFITLPLASLSELEIIDPNILREGMFGLSFLRPQALFGLEGMPPLTHSVIWSLLLNLGAIFFVSVFQRPSAIEHAQANIFVDIYRYESRDKRIRMRRGKAYLHDVRQLLIRFLGKERTEYLLSVYAERRNLNLNKAVDADPDLLDYAETLLAGAVGTASSRLLISSIVKEESFNIQEVMKVMDETQQLLTYSKKLEEKSRELELTSRELKRVNERLKKLDDVRNEFITTVTHELRTPITSIRSLSNILYSREKLDKTTQQEFLEIIVTESERISRLINQVLDLEKMEAGEVDLQLRAVNMKKLVKLAIKNCQPLLNEKKADIEFTCDRGVKEIEGDWDRMMQVVVNLLSNAIKFCDEKEGKIEIFLSNAGNQVQLAVKDNGLGLTEEQLPNIFDKFTQYYDHKRGMKQGSGLGLSISWRIVSLHKGKIWVESTYGEGATFNILLPVWQEQFVQTFYT